MKIGKRNIFKLHDLPSRPYAADEAGAYAVASKEEVVRDLRRYANHADAVGQTVQADRLRDLALRAETVLGMIEV